MLSLSTEQIECTRDEAVMLETVWGILAHPMAYLVERTGTAGETWVIREQVQAATQILQSARLPETDPESPRRKTPDHPVLACLHALETHRALLAWSRDPLAVPVFQRPGNGRLCRLLPPSLLSPAGHIGPIAFSVPDLRHAAALIVCGFRPLPQWHVLPGKPPGVAFAAESLSFPEIPRAAFQAAARASHRPSILGVDASGILLGNSPAGEHPWCYAIQALANANAAKTAQLEARKDPILMMRGRGLRSAVVTQSLMEESCRESALRDAVQPHLDGL